MIAAITEWVRNIILVVLFASFLELLLPSSSMQRFVRVIMGLLIMLAILNPAIDLLHNKVMPEPVPAVAARQSAATEAVKAGSMSMIQERDRLALDFYRKDLARQMRAVVMAIDGVAEARVEIELVQTQAGRPGMAIDTVVIMVQPGRSGDDRKVTKINIGKQPEEQAEELRPELGDRIKRTVRELYQLHDRQVEVKRLS